MFTILANSDWDSPIGYSFHAKYFSATGQSIDRCVHELSFMSYHLSPTSILPSGPPGWPSRRSRLAGAGAG